MKRSRLLSRFRKLYQNRFIFRCAVLALTALLYFLAPGQFEVLSGFECFRRLSVFHILWIIWMVDMVLQLIPSKNYWPLGSQKFLKESFQPLKDFMAGRDRGLLDYIVKSNRDTLLVGRGLEFRVSVMELSHVAVFVSVLEKAFVDEDDFFDYRFLVSFFHSRIVFVG